MHKLIQWFMAIALVSVNAPSSHANDIIDRLPTLGAESTIIPYDKEYAIGRAWLASFRRQAPVNEDPIVINYIEYLVYHLKAFADMDKYDVEIVVVDEPSINAFAVPGGVVGIHTGILLHTDIEDQLASIIAHELAHISQRHFARSNSQSNIPAMAGLLAGIIAIAAGAPDAGMAAITATQAGSLENRLAYSRQYEREADRTGLSLLAEAGYQPTAAADMFKIMLDQSRLNRSQQYSFFSTHPIVESRVADMRRRAENLVIADISKPSSDYDYIKAITVARRFSYAREAVTYFNAQAKSPSQQFGLAYALTLNRQFEESLRIIRSLYNDDPDRILLGVMKARVLKELQQYEEAEALLVKLYKFYPDNYPINYELAMVLEQQRKFIASKNLLQKLSYMRPRDPKYGNNWLKCLGLAGDIPQVHLARAEYFRYIGAYKTAERQLEILLKDENSSNSDIARAEHMLKEINEWKQRIES